MVLIYSELFDILSRNDTAVKQFNNNQTVNRLNNITSLMNAPTSNIGLFAAISIGIGAIVGGGILALAGAAFATTGPAALLAFGFWRLP